VAVTLFKSVSNAEDLSSKFAGCFAVGIPFGTYEVDLRTTTFDTSRTKGPKSLCIIDQSRSVCALETTSPDLLPASIHIRLTGLPRATPAHLMVSAAHSDWRRVVGVDAAGEATVATIWQELVAAVVVEGRVLGVAYLDAQPHGGKGGRPPSLSVAIQAGVVVSIASVRLRKPALVSVSRSMIVSTSRSERNRRSSFHTTSTSSSRS
jgi:hypothetical protein